MIVDILQFTNQFNHDVRRQQSYNRSGYQELESHILALLLP